MRIWTGGWTHELREQTMQGRKDVDRMGRIRRRRRSGQEKEEEIVVNDNSIKINYFVFY